MWKTIEQKFGTDKKLFLILTVSFEKQDEIQAFDLQLKLALLATCVLYRTSFTFI